jgi:hypothetical protein
LTSSLAPGAVRDQVKCRQRHRRARNRASKSEFRAPTECFQREGHTGGNANASFRQARRSPRAIRTSRNYARENRETSPASIGIGVDRAGKPKAQSGRERWRGVELGHSTCEAAEQSRWRHRPRRWWREGPGPRRTTVSLTRTRPERDLASPRGLLACAGERPTSARLTPDSVWGHIQGKNRMHYVASRIMWRPAENPHGIRTSVDLSAT